MKREDLLEVIVWRVLEGWKGVGGKVDQTAGIFGCDVVLEQRLRR